MYSTLHGLGELIAYLPYELGFRPRDSLVVIGLGDAHVQVVARLDLGTGGGFDPGVRQIAETFARADVREAVCCAFIDTVVATSPLDEPVELVERAAVLLRAQHVRIEHLLLTYDGRWWAHRCGCGHCPTDPVDVPGPDRVDAVLQSVLQGVVPLASRDELDTSLRHRQTGLAREVDAADNNCAPMSANELADSLWQILRGTTRIDAMPAAELAGVCRALVDPTVRDYVFGWVTPNLPVPVPLDGGRSGVSEGGTSLFAGSEFDEPAYDGAALRARLIGLLHCLPDRLRPPVLTLIAGSAWSSGSGALASIAVEQALQIDPHYRLAQLLGRAVELGAWSGRRA